MLRRALDSLARRVELERKEWRSANQVRKDFAYPHVQAAILDAAENPSRNVPNWLVLALMLSGVAWGLPFQFEVWPGDPYKSAEIISYLAALWAVQAAVVALVYPIVIGFVALLFQGVVMHNANPGVVLIWSAIDSVWFFINMALTAFFLVRTERGVVEMAAGYLLRGKGQGG